MISSINKKYPPDTAVCMQTFYTYGISLSIKGLSIPFRKSTSSLLAPTITHLVVAKNGEKSTNCSSSSLAGLKAFKAKEDSSLKKSQLKSLYDAALSTVDFFASIFFIPKHLELVAFLKKLTKLDELWMFFNQFEDLKLKISILLTKQL